ncbi:MAG: SMP-30/gluconolactonase/LRE family protein [Candidatus Sericytochromatia bacterium]
MNGILLHLTRKIPIPETTNPQPTPTPSSTTTIDKTKIDLLPNDKISTDYFKRVYNITPMYYYPIEGSLNTPTGIVVDSMGNIFVADTFNFSIKKITSDGTISTFAGSSRTYPLYNGNGAYIDYTSKDYGLSEGKGTNARFSTITGMVLDNSGNLFVTDYDNHRIRKITPDGTVSTFAGSSQGYVEGKVNGKLSNPNGITIDKNGNFFVIDQGNNCIRKITPDGTISTVVGSSGDFYKDEPNNDHYSRGIAVDKNGNLFITDLGNGKIKKITPDGNISDFYSTNNLSSAIAIDPSSGNLFITEYGKIKKITPSGVISSFTGNGGASLSGYYSERSNSLIDATWRALEGMFIDNSGTIFISETPNNRIRKIK